MTRRHFTALCAAAIVFCAPTAGAFDLPGGDLPRAQQARIARALGGRDAYAREGFEFAVNDYLARLGRDIAPANRRLIFAVKDRAVNAFAYAGGVVGILEGMILFCRSESELLGIVAHEFAHLEQDHFRRMAAKNRVGAFAAVIGVVAGALVGGQGGTAIAAGARGYALSRQLAYSRDLEEEADAVGFNALVAAGINPDGLAAAFSRMPDRGREYLQTHPGAIRRSQYLRARLAAVDLPPRPPSVDFALLRARLEFARAGRKQTIRVASAQLAQAEAGSTAAAAARYALLVKEIETGAPTRENLEAMSALAPESVFAALAAADGWPLLGEDEKAAAALAAAAANRPDSAALAWRRMRLWLARGEAETAADFFAEIEADKSRVLTPPELRAGAAAAQALKKRARANLLLARAHYLDGKAAIAKKQIALARRYDRDAVTERALADLDFAIKTDTAARGGALPITKSETRSGN